MTIDKQKLKSLLWAEAASFRADCADWERNTEALENFLGAKTLEEVALELLAENEDLREGLDKATRRNGMLEQNMEALVETHIRYTWLRMKVDQPSNNEVAVTQNIGHDWIAVRDLDRAVDQMIEAEQP